MPAQPFDLEQPLPKSLVGVTHGWFMAYRRYPVYGRRWTLLRLRPVLLYCLLWLLGLAGAVASTTKDLRALGGMLMVVVQMAMPVLLGSWLALRTRRRFLGSPHEGKALLIVLSAVTVATVLVNHWFGEPVKQSVAEWVGATDADGRRKPFRMVIGMTVTDGEDAAPRVPGGLPPDRPPLLSSSTFGQAFIVFWLAGGLALLSWRQQNQGLALIEKEEALRRAQAERREAEMRLSVLAAQVEPHFLFNTLAGVRSAIHGDPPRAAEMIDRLVEYLRAAIPRLREDGSLQASVGAQCEIVRAYLALMSTRMPRLHFRIEVPIDLARAHFPPLMLISLAENAVKHGVEPKIGPALVEVHASTPAPGRLRLAVLDDGVGFGESAGGSGLGLANIRERLAQLYGDGASLALQRRPAGGVEASIELPLELMP